MDSRQKCAARTRSRANAGLARVSVQRLALHPLDFSEYHPRKCLYMRAASACF